jgi:transposase
MLFVGIDWGDLQWEYHARDAQQKVLAAGTVKTGFEGMAELFRILEAYAGPQEIAVAIETRHGVCVQALLDRGYQIYPVNPKAVERFREVLHVTGDKSDKIDAKTMSILLVMLHTELKPLKPDAPEIVAIRIACEDRVRLVEEHTAKLNELHSVLKAYYPAFEGLFGGIETDIALEFLMTFPTQDEMRALTDTRLRGWLVKHGYSHPDRIGSMLEVLHRPVLSVADHLQKAKSGRIRFLAQSLLFLNQEIHRRDDEIDDDLDQLPEAGWIRSLPGVGRVLAPALLACIGRDPQRFADVKSARALMGTAPVTKKSIKPLGIHFRVGCWKFARRTLQLFADQSRHCCDWAMDFYRRQRASGHHHHAALRALAHKWLKILLAMQRTGKAYDETIFVNSQKRYLLKANVALTVK